MIEGVKQELEVYGEVYRPKHWIGWQASRDWHQPSIEVYVNQRVYEIPIKEVLQWTPKGTLNSE